MLRNVAFFFFLRWAV